MSDKACDRPCANCPWLRANQTAEAIAASPIDGTGTHWFSRENLLRHWRGVQTIGIMLPCHKTDENAHLYGGTYTKRGTARICVGLSVLARREVTAFMTAGSDFVNYRRLPGKRLSARALASWAARLYYGGATFHVGSRAFMMPERVAEDPRVGVPWKDSVHNNEATTS